MEIGSKVYIKKDIKDRTHTASTYGKVVGLGKDGKVSVECELITRQGRWGRGFFRLTFRREDLELPAA